jgi:hypothetical protein
MGNCINSAKDAVFKSTLAAKTDSPARTKSIISNFFIALPYKFYTF